MAYSKQNFQNGQILNAANLEAMENGIIAGQGAHNLLDNSDFRIKNNIINTKGLLDYSFDSGNVFDRWRLHWTGDGRVSIKDGYIELYREANSVYLFQHPRDLQSMVGKTYTVAAKVRYNGYIGWIDSTQRVNCGLPTLSDWDIVTCTFTVGSATSDIGEAGIEIASRSNLSFEVQWVALYEGAYTKETLPVYLTKGKHVEMLNCGVPLAPHNLLDNSDFTNPVNQRGATEATMGKYFIDRWKVEAFSSGPSITINSNGLTLLPTTSSTAGIYQNLPDYENRKGKVHTFAICVDNVWKCVSFTMGNFGVGCLIHGLYFFSVDNQNILIRNNASDTPVPITIQRVALYEGSYTADTLPPYIPKGKHVEMLNCGVPISPKNVLKNSDFTNPLNTKGFSSISSGAYTTIDCWNSWISGDGGKIELTSSGIKLSPPSSENIGIYQQIENYQLNKIYTVVVYINDLPYLKSFQMGNYGVGTNFGPVYFYSIPSANVLIRINSTGSAVTIQKIALYEGAYTLDTIPMYQSENKHIEMLNCNVPLAPHNFLDNSDFRNPINQRGQKSYKFDSGYTIDRWKLHWSGDGDITIHDGYISLYRETHNTYLFQFPANVEKMVGKTYTVAAKVRYNGYIGWIDSTQRTHCNSVHSLDWVVITHTFTVGSATSDIGPAAVEICSSANLSIELQWIALYEGSYTADTLPAYQPKGYAAELAECQRYYQQYNGSEMSAVGDSESGITYIRCPLKAPMRVAPSLVQSSVDMWTTYNETANKTETYTFYSSTPQLVTLKYTSSVGSNYQLVIATNNTAIGFSADL